MCDWSNNHRTPDTNRCDRFIFPRLESLRNDIELFKDVNDVTNFLKNSMSSFTADMMKKQFEILCDDLEKIIDKQGCYL